MATRKTPMRKTPTRKTAAAKGKGARPRKGRGPSADIARRLAALSCDPIAIIAEIAGDPEADRKLRFAAAKELAAYLMAKPRGAGAPPPPSEVDVGAIIAGTWPPAGREKDSGETPADGGAS